MGIRHLLLAGALVATGALFGADAAATPEQTGTTAGAPEKTVTTQKTVTTEKTVTPEQTVSETKTETPDKTVTTQKTVTTETVVVTEKTVVKKEEKKPAAPKPRIAVFAFTTIDIQGQHFGDFTERTVTVTPQNSLNDAELGSIDEIMLGYIKMIDAEEERTRRAHDREHLDAENARNLARQNELADKLLKTPQRAVVIGANFMEGALGNYDSVELVDRGDIYKAYRDMSARQAGEQPRTLPEVLQLQGATHVLYGTVADFRVAGNEYTGYGINTKSLIYELDVMIKIVELKTNRIVFSGVFTGQSREFYLDGQKAIIDSGRFETLMKSATAQAAAAIDKKFDQQESK